MDPLIAQIEIDETVTNPIARASARGVGRPLFYRVLSADRSAALEAEGIPRRGEVMPAPAEGLIAIDIEARPHPRSHAETLVRVAGVSPEIAVAFDSTLVAGPLNPFTTFRSAVRGVPVREAYNTLLEEVVSLPRGETLTEEISEIEVSAHVFTGGPGAGVALNAWKGIQSRHNTNSVLFPPLRFQGAGSRLTAGAGELLARGVTVTARREGVVELAFAFGLAPADSWRVILRLYDAMGNATSEMYAPQGPPVVYPASLTNLFEATGAASGTGGL